MNLQGLLDGFWIMNLQGLLDYGSSRYKATCVFDACRVLVHLEKIQTESLVSKLFLHSLTIGIKLS